MQVVGVSKNDVMMTFRTVLHILSLFLTPASCSDVTVTAGPNTCGNNYDPDSYVTTVRYEGGEVDNCRFHFKSNNFIKDTCFKLKNNVNCAIDVEIYRMGTLFVKKFLCQSWQDVGKEFCYNDRALNIAITGDKPVDTYQFSVDVYSKVKKRDTDSLNTTSSGGIIAAIAISVLVFIACFIGIMFWAHRRRQAFFRNLPQQPVLYPVQAGNQFQTCIPLIPPTGCQSPMRYNTPLHSENQLQEGFSAISQTGYQPQDGFNARLETVQQHTDQSLLEDISMADPPPSYYEVVKMEHQK